MSLLPKINIGVPFKKSTNNWSFDSSTTANIGSVQPTFARLLPNDSHIEINDRSIVRLASLVNPTFGRLSQRDYYRFVRMTDVYRPWPQFLSKKNFTSDDVSYIPTVLPKYPHCDLILRTILRNSYWSITPANFNNSPVRLQNNQFDNLYAYITKCLNYGYQNMLGDHVFSFAFEFDLPHVDDLDNPFAFGAYVGQDSEGRVFQIGYGLNDALKYVLKNNVEPVSYQNSDFSFFIPSSQFNGLANINIILEDGTEAGLNGDIDGVYVHFRLKPGAKNLRKIMLGLGYSFNPFDLEPQTPFKLLAYYKAYFDQFYPQRNLQFTDTECYKIIKLIENNDGTWQNRFCTWFLNLMSDFNYFTAPDYFSAALYNLGDNTLNNGDTNKLFSPYYGNINDYRTLDVESDVNQAGSTPTTDNLNTLVSYQKNGTGTISIRANGVSSTTTQTPDGVALYSRDRINDFFNLNSIALPMLLKMLRFTNKDNIVGRNIRNYLKVHYGIDDAQLDSNMSTKIDSKRLDINFFDVMNQAASPDAYLGEFAGQGFGSREDKDSKTTYFDTKDWGFIFCMSVLVPDSGYYQGSLKENSIATREEFFMPEYDACGYDVISRGEILNDFHVYKKSDFDGNKLPCETFKGFGFIPRYTFQKVAKNIVNGDLSLHSTKDGLQGYYLDKQFPTIKEVHGHTGTSYLTFDDPDYLPDVVSDNIRKIDPSDKIGNYNRIFNYVSTDADHFVIQKVFDIKVTALWKSIKDSFDTIQQDEHSIERNHQ